ncbi:hypothetical protein ASE86_09315 [Sphingomonas sp. Leaf33]|uniref:hypothetical protein n=1 Tax=Sphingomonas sp. Leaf33 TaxID=1736215 RepID=UPI0006F43612|nr:hypothetical protein [Sphingomonas sp. Leaf33]KQN26317.1 hypothetical protein ASE86_09315 [Sphingomonas sp. Leaf33]
MIDRRTMLGAAAAGAALPAVARITAEVIRIATPMATPTWAMLQRRLLAAHADACAAFYARYVGPKDELRVFPRWGANDGPDDAAEATNDWVTLHALGAPDNLLTMAQRFWEGHLRQYTAERTVEVPIARGGMYFREFPVQMDWQHNSEGLTTFNVFGLSAPKDRRLFDRTRRYADFYTGRDPSAPNYDPRVRVMRSMMTGSRGPMLRAATPLDWAGDPFDPRPFHLEHGETSYAQTLDHYAGYEDVVCDSPLNLQATTLALNAYALGAGDRFRTWVLDYLGAWAERARVNGDMLPSKVSADGRAAPDWWAGVYGWGFSPIVPQTGERENRNRVPRSITAFLGGLLLSGDMALIELWRRQSARINAASKRVNGEVSAPTMYGADGWYGWKPGAYRTNGFEIWYATQAPEDRAAAGDHPWIAFLEGRNPGYAETALKADLDRVAERVAAMRDDRTTPQTRLADWPIDKNPASANALIQTMTGGLHIARPPWSPTSPPQGGVPLHCRLRYFDADRRRAGVPDDVAALVTALGDRSTEMTLVNTGARARTVIVQGGAYAEHRIDTVTVDGTQQAVGGRSFTLRLEPGCGARVTLAMTRYANRPSLAFPWDR